MKIFNNKKDLKDCILEYKLNKKTIGFVPTMGALHQGHLSLIQKAKKKNDIVVVSIFVNPTQFDNKEDLEKYPKTLENDCKLLESVACNVLFTPSVDEIYADKIISEKFSFDGLEHQMEGKFRDGHFDGVGTIVKTLFEIVTPNKAYFGEKDFQQLQIIKKMVQKHQLDVKIKGCPIFREDDGLAMSSRNTRLTKEHREIAPFIYKTLKKVKKNFGTKSVIELNEWVENQFKNQPLLKLEYFTIAEEKTLETAETKIDNKKYRAFIAVFAGEIRLIDNIRLKNNN
ncbi:pantoate--beta-alanine ligase [Polaribacter sp. BM10]|uniref:pantoate--beta-alanine ligase n=1 Tax=Polaribacter sp. BM10 TaxID=1529069 RepID=UPI000989D431|nr:pantoate--beta-alanine ligase [Polaribacter sp. BM10]AQS94632.1 pantoate--beta-alanine ligase [Polaribacter sp. BM10]